MPDTIIQIDVRKYLPKDRYPTVSKTFGSLKPGEKMELINDHDMRPLFQYKFTEDFPNQYEWSYLEEGPDIWRVSVIKK